MGKVVFLDIDGVILPWGVYSHLPFDDMSRKDFIDQVIPLADPRIVDDLKRMVLEAEAKFVLISTWRILFDPELLKQYFDGIGLNVDDWFHTDWIADDPYSPFGGSSKSRSISNWLREHEYEGDWLLIDDEADSIMDSLPHIAGGNSIKPAPREGFKY